MCVSTIAMALQAPQSKDIAAAINSLLKLDTADQGSLLETIENYFTSPSRAGAASGTDSDTEMSARLNLKPQVYKLYIYFMFQC